MQLTKQYNRIVFFIEILPTPSLVTRISRVCSTFNYVRRGARERRSAEGLIATSARLTSMDPEEEREEGDDLSRLEKLDRFPSILLPPSRPGWRPRIPTDSSETLQLRKGSGACAALHPWRDGGNSDGAYRSLPGGHTGWAARAIGAYRTWRTSAASCRVASSAASSRTGS